MPSFNATFTYQTEDLADIIATFTPDAKEQFGTDTPTNAQVLAAIIRQMRQYAAGRVKVYRSETSPAQEPDITES